MFAISGSGAFRCAAPSSFQLERTLRPDRICRRLLTIILLPLVLAACAEDKVREPSLIVASAADIQGVVREAGAKAVLVNVWATWCIPCREEFPDILKLYRTHKDDGLRLVLVSADFENQTDAVQAFLAENGVDFDTYLKAEKDTGFIEGMDAEWSAALPASWIYDGQGNKVAFWEGKADYEKFEAEVLAVLK